MIEKQSLIEEEQYFLVKEQCFNDAITVVEPEQLKRVLTFEEIHQVGAKRHTHQWIEANRAAISAMFAEGVSPTDMRMRRLVSMIVLRVLDATSAPAL